MFVWTFEGAVQAFMICLGLGIGVLFFIAVLWQKARDAIKRRKWRRTP